jgi:hypothetical protein
MRWMEIAEQGQRVLSAEVPHGTTLSRRSAVAQELGVTGQTLSNYIDALKFVQELEATAPKASAAMSRLNPTSIAVYARWVRRDRRTALAHAIRAADEGLSTAKIIAAERAARQALARPATLVENALDEDRARDMKVVHPKGPLATGLLRTLGSMPRFDALVLDVPSDDLAVAMGVTNVLRWDGPFDDPGRMSSRFQPEREPWFAQRRSAGPYEVIGLVPVERGRAGDGHRRNARTVFAKAVVATSLFPVVVVMLEDEEALAEFKAMLPTIEGGRLGRHAVVEEDLYALSGDGGCVVLADAATSLSRDWG